MPLADAAFKLPSGLYDQSLLIKLGPTVQAVVSHYAALTQPAGAAAPQSEVCMALVDTGAEESCIDQALAVKLGLPVVDVIMIAGAGGAKQHPVFLAQVVIPVLGFMQFGRFAGVDLTGGGQIHNVLLGRTFLANVLMVYDGLKSQVTLAAPVLPTAP